MIDFILIAIIIIMVAIITGWHFKSMQLPGKTGNCYHVVIPLTIGELLCLEGIQEKLVDRERTQELPDELLIDYEVNLLISVIDRMSTMAFHEHMKCSEEFNASSSETPVAQEC